jgi:hypothetical protein
MYAKAGERIEVDGRYLCTVAKDLGGGTYWHFDDFEDWQIDPHGPERLKVTSWLVRRIQDRSPNG